ncbi:MAG: hypothetical protein FD189_742 [Elusimicrobia bacterium]|nr:MAG: hypothetical protein FD154_673 [Elusimicrobiota bacterium]KAF0156988.1 MAG: hypothetical protein FD189_742 [Elusimicrobiota bacterium]
MRFAAILISIAAFLAPCASAQTAEEVGREILTAYKNRDLEGVKRHLPPVLAMTVDKTFFKDKAIKSEVVGLRRWDGKVREVRYFATKAGVTASVYYDEDADPAKVRTFNLNKAGNTWKQALGSFLVLEKEKFAAYEGKEPPVRAAARKTPAAAPAIVQGAPQDSPNKGYVIEMADGTVVKDPTVSQLQKAFEALGEENFFITLNAPDGFITASRSGAAYDIEYKDEQGQFAAIDEMSADQAMDLFSAYIKREKTWKAKAKWRPFD